MPPRRNRPFRNSNGKEGTHMKMVRFILMILFLLPLCASVATATGPFGPPQPVAKEAGGLHTGIGYWFQQDAYEDGGVLVARQKQIYSELGWANGNGWGITARVGVSDFKMADLFGGSATPAVVSGTDLKGQGKFFATVGTKFYHPFGRIFGVGGFVQGSYCFSDFTDSFSGMAGGSPFSTEIRIRDLWDARFGIAVQATLPYGIRIYGGPYGYHAEFQVSSFPAVSGVPWASGETVLRNKNAFGGFAGVDAPLGKGFRLNLEGEYAEKVSGGISVVYLY